MVHGGGVHLRGDSESSRSFSPRKGGRKEDKEARTERRGGA